MKKKVKITLFSIAGILLLAFVILFILLAAGESPGNVSSAKTIEVGSEIYTSSEIDGAINAVKETFHDHYKGSKLIEIYYAGDENIHDYTDHDKSDVIVLLSKFYVYPFGGNGFVPTNCVCDKWHWTLTRENGGEWKLISCGC